MNWATLAPWMTGGILFVALPILIHLISRKKARPLEFAAIAFVLQSQKKTARSMRLKEMILLLLRCLWVLCLALAFLQPVLEENRELEQNRQEPKIIILVMDLSASMQATVAGASRFEAAVTKATEEISNSESEVQWGLIGCNRGLTATQIAPTFDRDKMFQALSTLKVSSMSARLPACIDAAQGLLAGKEEPVVRKIWVLSDMAKHAFTGAVAPAVGKVQIHFEKIDEETPPNWFINSLSLSPQRNDEKPTTQMQIEVKQIGLTQETDTVLDIFENDANVARQTVSFSVEQPVVNKDVHLTHATPELKGETDETALVLHTQLGEDALLADNEIFLPAQTVRPIHVLIVDGAPHSVPYRDEVYYLANALQKKNRRSGQFQVQVLLPEDLTLANLATANVVYLCNVQKLSQPMTQALLQIPYKPAGGFLCRWVTKSTLAGLITAFRTPPRST